MTDTVTAYRPSAVVSAGDWSPSAGTLFGTLSDVNDATYVTVANPYRDLVLQIGAIAIPALSIIHRFQVKVRASNPGFGLSSVLAGVYDGTTTIDGTANPSDGTVREYITVVRAVTPSGGSLTAAYLTTLEFYLSCGDAGHRVHDVWIEVIYNQAPTAAPSISSVGESRPIVTLAYSDPESDTKERHEIAVFTSAVGDPFGADIGSALWYSGEVFTAATTQQVGVRLQDKTAYWVYSRAADTGSNGRYGPVASATWTTLFEPVGAPLLPVMYVDETTASVENVGAQGRPNLLTFNQSCLETDASGWAAGGNTTIAQGAVAFRGSHGLALTAIGAGDISASTTPLEAIAGGQLCSAMVTVKPGTTARVVDLFLNFHTGSGTLIYQVASESTELAATWTRLWVEARAPAAAAQVSITVVFQSAVGGEIHHIDSILIAPSTFNPVDNSDLHEDLAHGWVTSSAGSSVAQLLTTNGAHGTRSVQLEKNDTNDATLQTSYFFGVQPGELIILSLDLWCEWLSAGVTQATLSLVWNDTTRVDVQITDLPIGQWSRRSLIATVPGGKTSVTLMVAGGNRADATSRAGVLVDGVQIERVPVSAIVNGGFENFTTFSSSQTGRHDLLDGVGWVADSNLGAGVLVDSVTFHGGAKSLRLGGAAGVINRNGWYVVSQDVHVAGRSALSLDYWWRLLNVKQSHVKVTFYDAARQIMYPRAPLASVPAGALDSLSSVFVPFGTDSAGYTGWVHNSYANIPIPNGAVWAVISLLGGWSYDNTNDGFTWFDDFTVTLTGSAAASRYTPGGWTVGGYSAGYAVLIERSADGGLTWQPVRVNDQIFADGAAVTTAPWLLQSPTDYEAPLGRAVLYRATAIATANGQTTASVSDQVSVTTVKPRRLWMKDPRDHTRNHAFYTRPPGVTPNATERQVVKQTLGSTDEVVIADTLQGESIGVPLVCLTQADLDALKLLRSGQRTLLVQNHLGWQWYVRLGPSAPITPVDATPVTYIDLTGLPQLAPLT